MREELKALRFNYAKEPEYPEDVARLRAALNELGYDAPPMDVAAAYELYSDREWCAGWLALPTSDSRLADLCRHMIRYGYLAESTQ